MFAGEVWKDQHTKDGTTHTDIRLSRIRSSVRILNIQADFMCINTYLSK